MVSMADKLIASILELVFAILRWYNEVGRAHCRGSVEVVFLGLFSHVKWRKDAYQNGDQARAMCAVVIGSFTFVISFVCGCSQKICFADVRSV